MTITLILTHSSAFGLLTFGSFAVLTGAVLVVASLRSAIGFAPVDGKVGDEQPDAHHTACSRAGEAGS